jgi:hypothetical protein
VAFGFSGASDAEEKPGGHGGSQLWRRDGDLWWLAMVKNLGAYGGGQPSACERGLGVVVVQIGTRGRGKAVDTGARRRAVVNKGWQHA